MKTLTLILVAFFISVEVIAQTPQSFRYQAVARDNSGNVLGNQAVSFRIGILSGSVSGTAVYSETHTGLTTNAFGLVELEIGKGISVSGTFSGIDWDSDSYFVKVQMDPEGGTAYQFLSTSQLLSVPYALHAKTVETGDNWGSQVTVSDESLSGTGTTITPLKIAQQSATTGQVLKWSGTAWSPSVELWTETNGNVYRNTGKVGIGATNPEALLHVRSNTPLLGIFAQNNNGGWALQANSYTATGVSVAALTDGGTAVSAESPGILAKLCSTPDNAAGYFSGNVFVMGGKVGIGSTNPQAILDVRSKTTLGGIFTESAGGWSFQSNSYGGSGVSVAALTDGGTAVSAESPGMLARLCSTADNAAGYFNGNVFMMGGKVGIGAANPQTILDVRSKTTLGGIFTESAGGWSFQSNSFGANGVSVAALTDGGTAVSAESPGMLAKLCSTADNAAGYFFGNVFVNSGKLGIGTTTPNAPLEISAAAGPNLIIHDSNGSNDRPGIQFTNNYIHFIGGDDSDNEIFGFYSQYGNNRIYAARLNIHGPATNNWGKYIGFTHDGNNGRIDTDAGNLILQPAGQRVGVGTNSPVQALHVVGNAYKTEGGTSWATSSDLRLKTVLGEYEKGLDEIAALKAVRFVYNPGNMRQLTSGVEQVGFVAQEVQKIFPEAVTEAEDGYLDFNIHAINIALVNAVKRLKTENDRLKAENELLLQNDRQQNARLQKLELLLGVAAEN
jgi:hypothetical protein